MSNSVLTQDSEDILLYLSKTERQIERTKHALREACQLTDGDLDTALRALQLNGLITNVNDGEFQLTHNGKKSARTIYTEFNTTQISTQIINKVERMEGGTVQMAGRQDSYSTPIDRKSMYTATGPLPADEQYDTPIQTLCAPADAIPSLYHHPLRLSGALMDKPPSRRPNTVLRFMLAFEMPKDALPIPLLHGDVLGRSRSADICLRHDDYVSTRHCRFDVRQEGGTAKLYVEDLGSRNGTFIDNSLLQEHKPRLLKHGTRLQIGNTVFVVVQIP